MDGLLEIGNSLAEELKREDSKWLNGEKEAGEIQRKMSDIIAEDLRNELGLNSKDLQVEDLEINPERAEFFKKALEELDERLEKAMSKKLENEGKKLNIEKVVEGLKREDSKWFSREKEVDEIEKLKANIEEDKKIEALAAGVPVQGDLVKRANQIRDLNEKKIEVVEKLLEEKGLNKVEERNQVWKMFNDDLLLVKKEMGVDDETWKKLVQNETEIQVSIGVDDRGTAGFAIYNRDRVLDVVKDITEQRIEIIENRKEIEERIAKNKKAIEEKFDSVRPKLFID